MKFIRAHKKISIVVLVVAMLIILFGSTLARYIYNVVNNYILESREFYFNSTILDMNGKDYKINNWDGVNDYTLTIDVTNKKNSLASTKSDIAYDIEVSCPDSVECNLSKTNGIIFETATTDTYEINVVPIEAFHEGDEVTIETTATSTSPYVKSLSATYTLGVETSNFTYDIEDNTNDKYLTLNLTNSVTFYEVETSFSNYNEGDRLTIEEYNALTEEQKQNCFSAIVTLSFPPDEIYLDMTNTNYLHRQPNSETEEEIEGYSYVNGFSFKMDASSSEKVMFYKKDPKDNFTYPITNETPIVTVTVQTAD